MAKTVTEYHGKYKGIIVSKTNMRNLRKDLKVKMTEISDFIIFRFQQIGEEAVKTARDCGRYNDITGNLRSSIGYIIIYDGKVMSQGGFQPTNGEKGNGDKGIQEGLAFLEKLKAKFPWGIAIVLCAGMEYAAYVEYHKDKDVLHSAEQIAERLVNELLDGIAK